MWAQTCVVWSETFPQAEEALAAYHFGQDILPKQTSYIFSHGETRCNHVNDIKISQVIFFSQGSQLVNILRQNISRTWPKGQRFPVPTFMLVVLAKNHTEAAKPEKTG